MPVTVKRRQPPPPQAVKWNGDNVREVAQFIRQSVTFCNPMSTLTLEYPLEGPTGVKYEELFPHTWVVKEDEQLTVYVGDTFDAFFVVEEGGKNVH